MKLISSTQDFVQSNSKQPHILLVDDHDDSLALLACALDAIGCSYEMANCGVVAMGLAEVQHFDLALIDIILPDFSGIDLLKHIKKKKLQSDIKAIAVTALAFAKDREKIQKAGFDDYICKPYLLKDLERMLHNHLSQPKSCTRVLDC